MVAALHSSRSQGTKSLQRNGITFGWETIQDVGMRPEKDPPSDWKTADKSSQNESELYCARFMDKAECEACHNHAGKVQSVHYQ